LKRTIRNQRPKKGATIRGEHSVKGKKIRNPSSREKNIVISRKRKKKKQDKWRS